MIKNKISRRSALKITGSGALVAGTGITPALADTPKRGGKLRIVITGGSVGDNFDPAVHNGAIRIWNNNFTNRLIKEVAKTGELVAELATSWESSNQNRVWDLKLRKGVKFQDGSEFTSKDAVYSIKYHTAEGTKSAGKSFFSDLKELKATGKYSMRFEFNSPESDLPAILTMYNFMIIKDGHKDWLKAMGTGPYRIKKFEPGTRVVMERFEDYWDVDNSAWVDTIEYVYINDRTSEVNAFLSGQVDLITLDTKAAKRLEKLSKVNVVKTEGKRHFTLGMDSTQKPFGDVNIARAIKYSMDRETIIKNAMDGYGSVASDNPISSAYADYVPVKGASYDLDKAKYYLKKSGNSKLDINVSVSNAAVGADVESAALIVSENAKKAGINMKVVREPGDGYWSNVWLKKSFYASFWVGRPTALMMFNINYKAGAKWNETRFNNDSFEKLLKAAAGASASKKKELLGEAQQIVTSEGTTLIPAFQVMIEASMKSKIGGHTQSVSMPVNNHYVDELWVK